MTSTEKNDFYVKKIGPHHRVFGPNSRLLKKANEFLLANEIRGLSPQTIRSYGFDLAHLLTWLKSTNHIFEAVTHSDLYEYINSERKNDRKPATINRKLSTIQAFYRFVHGKSVPIGKGALMPQKRSRKKRSLYQKRINSFLKVKEPRTVVEPLSVDDIDSFLSGITKYRDLAIVFLMYMCGCRSCEVLSLQISDINSLERKIRLQGKGRKERIMPLPDILITILDRYFQVERPDDCETTSVFVVLQGKSRGQPMTVSGFRKIFRYHRARSGITKANPHRFRHSFGTEMARSNVRLATLQKMMGHSDPGTTLKYINLSLKDVSSEYERAIKEIQRRYESKI